MLEEVRIVREQGAGIVSSGGGSNVEQHRWGAKLQAVMLALREVGNEELEVTSQIVDTVSNYKNRITINFTVAFSLTCLLPFMVSSGKVEDYHQQLSLSEKEMDNCRTRDELTGARSSAAPSHGHKSVVTPPSKPVTLLCPNQFSITFIVWFYSQIFATSYSN